MDNTSIITQVANPKEEESISSCPDKGKAHSMQHMCVNLTFARIWFSLCSEDTGSGTCHCKNSIDVKSPLCSWSWNPFRSAAALNRNFIYSECEQICIMLRLSAVQRASHFTGRGGLVVQHEHMPPHVLTCGISTFLLYGNLLFCFIYLQNYQQIFAEIFEQISCSEICASN